jgi:hypothetical protein
MRQVEPIEALANDVLWAKRLALRSLDSFEAVVEEHGLGRSDVDTVIHRHRSLLELQSVLLAEQLVEARELEVAPMLQAIDDDVHGGDPLALFLASVVAVEPIADTLSAMTGILPIDVLGFDGDHPHSSWLRTACMPVLSEWCALPGGTTMGIGDAAAAVPRYLTLAGQWIEHRDVEIAVTGTTWQAVLSRWNRRQLCESGDGFVELALRRAKRGACPFVKLSDCPVAYDLRRGHESAAGRRATSACVGHRSSAAGEALVPVAIT